MKIIKILFIVLFVALIVAGIGFLTYYKEWPWWVGVSMFAVLVGIYVGVYFLKKYLIRRRQKSFISKVSNVKKKQAEIKEIDGEWQNYYSILQNNQRSIYELPWFMVIGQSRSGKTSFIKYSDLSIPITPVSRSSKVYSTKYCDWWFFEEAVVLDMAGRYSVSEDINVDEEEWKELLSLLSDTRQKEPLNGIVCVVSADKFFDQEQLKIEAQNIKARINEVMQGLGVNIPVFIMISKMDLIGGFVPFFKLYQEHFDEVMGYINENNLDYQKAMIDSKKLLKERLLFLYKNMENISSKESAFLLEFDELLENLDYFIDFIFKENIYFEEPMFRGIYFSSALQTESEYKFFKQFEIDAKDIYEEKNSIFIKDFFKDILPAQRGIYKIIKTYLSKRFKSQKIMFFTALIGLLGISGVVGYVSFQEYELIKSVKQIKPIASNDLNENVMNLQSFQQQREQFNYDQSKILLPIYPFDEQLNEILKENYVTFFESKLLKLLKEKLTKDIQKIKQTTNYKRTDYYMGFLVDTILTLQQSLNDNNIHFSKYFSGFVRNFVVSEINVSYQVAQIFADEYLIYLKSNNDFIELKNQLQFYQTQIESILESKSTLRFLTDESVSLLPPITIGEFWNIKDDEFAIPGAFTDQGRKNIQISIDQLREVVKDKKRYDVMVQKYRTWYKNEFFKKWYLFSNHFDIKQKIIKNDSVLSLDILAMSNEDNPYFSFLKKFAFEIRSYQSVYDWNKLLLTFDDVRALAKTLRQKNSSVVAKINFEKEKLKNNIKNKTTKNKNIKRAVLYNKYVKNFQSFADIADAKQSYLLVKNLYNTSDVPSKLSQLYYSFVRFKAVMPQYSANTFNVWNLIQAPKDFIFYVSFHKTAKILNQLWNQQVLSNLTLYSIDELFAQNGGYVRKFMNNYINIFLVKTPFGYKPKEKFGYKLDFTNDFLNFLNQLEKKYAAKKSIYNVKFTTFPIEANKKARFIPYRSTLILECQNKTYSLDNYNYKNSEIFKWNKNCGEVKVDIYVNKVVLHKKFPTFIDFVKSLENKNTLVLTQKDLDNEYLKTYNIKWIKLKYGINYDGFLDSYATKIKVPYTIIKEK